MKIFNWLKKNWILVSVGGLIIIIIFAWGVRACDGARYKKNIKELDGKIVEKEKRIAALEADVLKGVKRVLKAEAVVAVKEENLEKSRLRILTLERKEAIIVEIVMALPPSRLVEEFWDIPDCQKVELTEKGILFPVKCAQAVLVKLERFDLVLAQLKETRFSLSESMGATEFQKQATAHVYGIAADLTKQIAEYKEIVKAKDLKFDLCEKQRKKGFWRGLKTGLVIGGGITITFVIILPLIKSIF